MDFIELMDFCGYDLQRATKILQEADGNVDSLPKQPGFSECRGLFGAGCVGCSEC